MASSSSTDARRPDRHGFLESAQSRSERTSKPKEPLSSTQILERERKWLNMLDNWPLYMSKNYKEIRDRCRKGIPKSIRPRAWFYLSGAYLLKKKNPNLYKELLSKPGNRVALKDITKDQNRLFALHEMFSDDTKAGRIEMYNVLKAYSIYNPKVGYSQAQGPVAAFLLMHLPAEDAFWVFVSVCDVYMEDYYLPGMVVVQNDGAILERLLKKTYPPVYHHLKKYNVEPLHFMSEWFMGIMTRTLPWETVLRIWDCFLAEGITVIFKAALVILGAIFGRSEMRKQYSGYAETIQVLQSLPPKVVEEEFIIQNIQRLNLCAADFQIEHTRQMRNRSK